MTFQELMDRYLRYVGRSEAPEVYHRWSFVGCLSAALGRKVWIPMGHFTVYPNMYIMLMGDPGARKSTAINIAKDLLKQSGFSKFAGTQVTRERFYMALDGAGELDLHSVSQQFICAPEFNNFIGIGNSGFISALTELFDADKSFDAQYKNSKDNIISNPCVGILGGNTQQAFSEAFPPSILHNGFLSRLILVWGQKTGERIAFLQDRDSEERQWLADHITSVREGIDGQLNFTPEAIKALGEIYRDWDELEDSRFVTYGQRRYTHLLKLCVVCAASTGKLVIEYADVLYANTLLVSAELYFSRALGEFGKAKNSGEASIVMNALYNAKGPMSPGELWRTVSTNLEKWDTLREILTNLTGAGKVIQHHGGLYSPKPVNMRKMKHINLGLLGEALASTLAEEIRKMEEWSKDPMNQFRPAMPDNGEVQI